MKQKTCLYYHQVTNGWCSWRYFSHDVLTWHQVFDILFFSTYEIIIPYFPCFILPSVHSILRLDKRQHATNLTSNILFENNYHATLFCNRNSQTTHMYVALWLLWCLFYHLKYETRTVRAFCHLMKTTEMRCYPIYYNKSFCSAIRSWTWTESEMNCSDRVRVQHALFLSFVLLYDSGCTVSSRCYWFERTLREEFNLVAAINRAIHWISLFKYIHYKTQEMSCKYY
jgi:hypothetical protein